MKLKIEGKHRLPERFTAAARQHMEERHRPAWQPFCLLQIDPVAKPLVERMLPLAIRRSPWSAKTHDLAELPGLVVEAIIAADQLPDEPAHLYLSGGWTRQEGADGPPPDMSPGGTNLLAFTRIR